MSQICSQLSRSHRPEYNECRTTLVRSQSFLNLWPNQAWVLAVDSRTTDRTRTVVLTHLQLQLIFSFVHPNHYFMTIFNLLYTGYQYPIKSYSIYIDISCRCKSRTADTGKLHHPITSPTIRVQPAGVKVTNHDMTMFLASSVKKDLHQTDQDTW